VPLTILQGTLKGEGGNKHVKELIKESRKSKGENIIKGANFAKVKIFFQRLHQMTFLC